MSDPVLTVFSGALFWLVLLSPILGTAAFMGIRLRTGELALLPALLLLVPAIPWVMLYTFAVLNRRESRLPIEVSDVVGFASAFVFLGTPILALVVVFLARGYRRAASFVGIANVVVGAATSMLSVMMISGNWI